MVNQKKKKNVAQIMSAAIFFLRGGNMNHLKYLSFPFCIYFYFNHFLKIYI